MDVKVKATCSFAGELCMAAGEIRDVPKGVAAPLIKCGYLKECKKDKPTDKSGTTGTEE